jgi:serine/threonine protein kinase
MNMADCPSQALLQRLLEEELLDPQREALEAHVETCAACQQLLERLTKPRGSLDGDRTSHGSLVELPAEEKAALLEWLERRPPPTVGTSMDATASRVPTAAAGTSAMDLPGYEFLEELGRGATGIVFKARRIGQDQLVAVKVLHCQPRPAKRARFRREIEALAWLRHPHIVRILEIGEHDGRLYFAMEYVGGGSLQRHLSRRPMPVSQAAALVATVARAVQAAHEQGVIHRDLKPANVLLAADGTPRISDFGLAKPIDAADDLTVSGTIIGTPCYMAPEQAWGQGHAAGPEADVYSLGAILYEALTGRPPFCGATVHEILEQARTEPPIPLRQLQPAVPAAVEFVCLKCLAKEPSQRYSSAGALADALEAAVHSEPEPIQPATVVAEQRQSSPSWLGPAVVAGSLAAGGIAVLLFLALLKVILSPPDRGPQPFGVAKATHAASSLKAADRTGAAGAPVEIAGRVSAPPIPREPPPEPPPAQGRAAEVLRRHTLPAPPRALSFLGNGQVLAFLADGASLRLQNLDNRNQELAISSRSSFSAAAFSPDGATLAWATADGTVALLDTATGKERWRTQIPNKQTAPQRVTFLTFAQTGKVLVGTVATGGTEDAPDAQGMQAWDVVTGKFMGDHVAPDRLPRCFAFSPDGKTMAGAADRVFWTWETATGKPLLRLGGRKAFPVRSVAFSPDGGVLATGNQAGVVQLWDSVSGTQTATIAEGTGAVHCLAFSIHGKQLAVGNGGREVLVYRVSADAASGRNPKP